MPNGLTLMLRPDSTYQLFSANEQLFPLRNGRLILLKQNNQYEYITVDSDFSRFWNPRIIELESELCRITLREEKDLQRVMNLQMELDRYEYANCGIDKQIDLLTREKPEQFTHQTVNQLPDLRKSNTCDPKIKKLLI